MTCDAPFELKMDGTCCGYCTAPDHSTCVFEVASFYEVTLGSTVLAEAGPIAMIFGAASRQRLRPNGLCSFRTVVSRAERRPPV